MVGNGCENLGNPRVDNYRQAVVAAAPGPHAHNTRTPVAGALEPSAPYAARREESGLSTNRRAINVRILRLRKTAHILRIEVDTLTRAAPRAEGAGIRHAETLPCELPRNDAGPIA
jgi:hypothetical protein